MKSQEELYNTLEKVEGIIRDNRLFETLQNASKMVNVISIVQKHSEESNDIAFKRASEDIIGMYSELLDEVIDDLQAKIKRRHTQRLTRGECTIELGFVLNDLLTNLERVSDHCSNVAICMIEIQQDAFDTHQYLLDIDKSKSSEYAQQYAAVARKYSLEA